MSGLSFCPMPFAGGFEPHHHEARYAVAYFFSCLDRDPDPWDGVLRPPHVNGRIGDSATRRSVRGLTSAVRLL